MAAKSIARNTGSDNVTLAYQDQGNETIAVNSDPNDLGSSRNQVTSIQTVGGAGTQNVPVSQAASPFPVNTTKSFSYTGAYQEVILPVGQYKLQVWGAQGGSNATASSYGITSQSGGKGGYSEGILILSQKTTVRVYVGGQGSSSSGGYNGGGGTTGSSSYSTGTSGQSGYEYGTSCMGGGGGATDIRLSDGALLSRMIVAGGGSGGAMCYRLRITSTPSWSSCTLSNYQSFKWQNKYYKRYRIDGIATGDYIKVELNSTADTNNYLITGKENFRQTISNGTTYLVVPDLISSGTDYLWVYSVDSRNSDFTFNVSVHKAATEDIYTSTDSQAGYAGGGTSGLGTYPGTQSAGGDGGAFGHGEDMSASSHGYCSGAGGGGWYGGGAAYSDSAMEYVRYMGGGSGWVNTYASRGNRPSGYAGLQLDSGITYAGDTSFPNTAGTDNETGHSGNGYAKITRLSNTSDECSVTKFKGAVDNDSFPEYGKVKIKINAGNVASFYWGNTPGTMKVTGSLYFTNQAGDNLGKTMEISATLSSYRISSGEGYLVLPYRYNLPAYISLSGLKSRAVYDIHELAYSDFIHYNDYMTLNNTKCFGDISDIAFDHVNLGFKACTDITGSIHKTIITFHEENLSVKVLELLGSDIDFDYNDCQYMQDLEILSGSKSSHGDFSKLGLTKVSSVYNYMTPASILTGSIEDFVANKISTGQNTGSFNLQYPETYKVVTYNGQTLSYLVTSGVIPNGENTRFSWDAQGNITWSAS